MTADCCEARDQPRFRVCMIRAFMDGNEVDRESWRSVLQDVSPVKTIIDEDGECY